MVSRAKFVVWWDGHATDERWSRGDSRVGSDRSNHQTTVGEVLSVVSPVRSCASYPQGWRYRNESLADHLMRAKSALFCIVQHEVFSVERGALFDGKSVSCSPKVSKFASNIDDGVGVRFVAGFG